MAKAKPIVVNARFDPKTCAHVGGINRGLAGLASMASDAVDLRDTTLDVGVLQEGVDELVRGLHILVFHRVQEAVIRLRGGLSLTPTPADTYVITRHRGFSNVCCSQ